eukprot:jgi/Bigna1/77272/fgenesh1_pg.46_\
MGGDGARARIARSRGFPRALRLAAEQREESELKNAPLSIRRCEKKLQGRENRRHLTRRISRKVCKTLFEEKQSCKCDGHGPAGAMIDNVALGSQQALKRCTLRKRATASFSLPMSKEHFLQLWKGCAKVESNDTEGVLPATMDGERQRDTSNKLAEALGIEPNEGNWVIRRMHGLDPLKRRDCSHIHVQKSHADEKNVKVMWKSQTLRQIDIRGTERVVSKSRMTLRFPRNVVPKCQELNAKKAEKASKRNRKSKEKSSSNQQLAHINEHRVGSSQPVVAAPNVSWKRSFIDKTIRGKVPAAFCVAVSVMSSSFSSKRTCGLMALLMQHAHAGFWASTASFVTQCVANMEKYGAESSSYEPAARISAGTRWSATTSNDGEKGKETTTTLGARNDDSTMFLQMMEEMRRVDQERMERMEAMSRGTILTGVSLGGAFLAANYLYTRLKPQLDEQREQRVEAERARCRRDIAEKNIGALKSIPAFANVTRILDGVTGGKSEKFIQKLVEVYAESKGDDKAALYGDIVKKIGLGIAAGAVTGQGFNYFLNVECPDMHRARSNYVKSRSFSPQNTLGGWRWYLTGYGGGFRILQHCQFVDRVVTSTSHIFERVSGQLGPVPVVFHRRYLPRFGKGIYRRHADYPALGMARMTTVIVDIVYDLKGYPVIIEYACAVAAMSMRFQEIRVLSRDRNLDASVMDKVHSSLRYYFSTEHLLILALASFGTIMLIFLCWFLRRCIVRGEMVDNIAGNRGVGGQGEPPGSSFEEGKKGND